MALHEQRCIPCEGGVPPLDGAAIAGIIGELNGDWNVVEGHHLERVWSFGDFQAALDFVNAAGAICEEQFHHADFDFGWGRAKVTIWTHKIDGLTESDFVLAAKLDQI
jgi:4a-hydroxytetrahydrobiopterin dehydratase